MSEKDALVHFNLAPLKARRDMAMLGVVHRTVLGRGPTHFREFFKKLASGRLEDPRGFIGGELVKRSAVGLVAVDNLLPDFCLKEKNVEGFQRKLRHVVCSVAVFTCLLPPVPGSRV